MLYNCYIFAMIISLLRLFAVFSPSPTFLSCDVLPLQDLFTCFSFSGYFFERSDGKWVHYECVKTANGMRMVLYYAWMIDTPLFFPFFPFPQLRKFDKNNQIKKATKRKGERENLSIYIPLNQ